METTGVIGFLRGLNKDYRLYIYIYIYILLIYSYIQHLLTDPLQPLPSIKVLSVKFLLWPSCTNFCVNLTAGKLVPLK